MHGLVQKILGTCERVANKFLHPGIIHICIRIYDDKADSYPQHVGKFFNFCIFISFFIHEVKKTLKFWVSEPYLYNKYQ